MSTAPAPDDAPVTCSTEVAAPPDAVWALISDLPGMGRFSPESTGGSWTGGHTGPAVGARFRGRNAQGRRRWSTLATVVECEPGRSFAFQVTSMGLPVALWRYDLEPAGAGCRVTESWRDRRGWLVRTAGALTTGISDRRSYAATSMEHTLRRVKEVAEGDAPTA